MLFNIGWVSKVLLGRCKDQSDRRSVGWEYVHVCIDNHLRVAFAKVMP
jgi:hypothetical protein